MDMGLQRVILELLREVNRFSFHPLHVGLAPVQSISTMQALCLCFAFSHCRSPAQILAVLAQPEWP